MCTKPSVLIAIILTGLLTLWPSTVHADDIQEHFSAYLAATLGFEHAPHYKDLLTFLAHNHEALSDVALPPPHRYYQHEDRIALIHDDYTLEIYPLQLPESPPQLLLYLRVWRPDVPFYGSFFIVTWNEQNRRLSTIGINGEIPANDYNEIIPIHLDDKTRGIAISSASGATGRVGDFTVLAYHPELGYDLVWTIGVSGLYTFIAAHEIPVTVSHIAYSSWEETVFPVTDLQGLSMVDLEAYLRRFIVTYRWDPTIRTFTETERIEVMHDFAVVNHFLGALIENDEDALSHVAIDSVLYDRLAQSISGFKASLPLLFAPDSRLVPLSAYDLDGWAKSIGIRIASGRGIPLAVVTQEASGGMFIDDEDILALALFELDHEKDAKITDIHYYEIATFPQELVTEREFDLRPSLYFNKLGIRAWARELGWAEINSRVKPVKSVLNVSDWISVDAILRSPLVRWVEYHYRSDLNFEPLSQAELLYQRNVTLATTPFLLALRSMSHAAVQPDNIRVFLADDRGNRWEGTIRPDPIEEQQVFGATVYSRILWLDFTGPSSEEEWDQINTLTLHVVRQDRFARADLTWSFAP